MSPRLVWPFQVFSKWMRYNFHFWYLNKTFFTLNFNDLKRQTDI